MILDWLKIYSYRKNIKKTSTISLVYKFTKDYDLQSHETRVKLQPVDCQKIPFPGRKPFSTIGFMKARDYLLYKHPKIML